MSEPSTYPSELIDRHGTLRYCKACEWSVKHTASYSMALRALAASLVPYVGEDDAQLTREQFLSIVVDRIQDDLKYRTW